MPDDIVVSNPGRRPVEVHHGSETYVVLPGATTALPSTAGAGAAHVGELLRRGLLARTDVSPPAPSPAKTAGATKKAAPRKQAAATKKATPRKQATVTKKAVPRKRAAATKKATPRVAARSPRKRTGGS